MNSLIKDYNKIYNKEEIKKTLNEKRMFKDGNLFIKKLPGNFFLFKRDLPNTKNLDNIYYRKEFMADTFLLFEEGLKWLYIDKITEYKNKNQKGGGCEERIAHILTTNKTAFYLTEKTEEEFLNSKNKKEKQQIINLSKEIGSKGIEIPNNYKMNSLILFFEKILELKNLINIDKFNITLRIKRIKRYKVDGMFINKNIIALDARSPESIVHELGHYIYENKLSFKLNNKTLNFEDYKKLANVNDKRIEQYDKLENYSKESEAFAFFFEDTFKF